MADGGQGVAGLRRRAQRSDDPFRRGSDGEPGQVIVAKVRELGVGFGYNADGPTGFRSHIRSSQIAHAETLMGAFKRELPNVIQLIVAPPAPNLRQAAFESSYGSTYWRWEFKRGFDVERVMNLTDVDDKTIRGAQAAGQTLAAFTKGWTDKFHADCKELGLLPPHVEPSAVEHIPQQVAMIKALASSITDTQIHQLRQHLQQERDAIARTGAPPTLLIRRPARHSRFRLP